MRWKLISSNSKQWLGGLSAEDKNTLGGQTVVVMASYVWQPLQECN